MQKRYQKKEDCCGCGACVVQCPMAAIDMAADEEGFLYPEIDEEKCLDCGLCEQVCAFQLTVEEIEQRANSVLGVYALKHKDPEVLKHSSSGGAFTAISDFVMVKNNNGGGG